MTDAAAPSLGARRVARNAAWLSMSRVVTAALLFGWQVALARVLGATEYGIYGSITALMGIAAGVVDLGVQTIVVRDIARVPALRGRLMAAALLVHTGLAVPAYFVLPAVAAAAGYDPRVSSLLWLAGTSLWIDAVGTLAFNQFIAAERMAWPALSSVAHALAVVVLGAVAIRLGGGLFAVYAALVAANAGRTVAQLLASSAAGWRPALPVQRTEAWRLLAAGAPLGIGGLLSIAFAHADKLVVASVLGIEATGQVTAAFLVAFGAIELLGSSLQVAMLPAMSRLAATGDRAAALRTLQHVCVFVTAASLPVSAVLGTFAGPATATMFGPGYGPAAIVLAISAWSIIPRLLEGFVVQALTVFDHQALTIGTRLLGLSVNLVVTLTLLPRYGLAGAAIGTVAGELVKLSAALWLLHLPASWWAATTTRLARWLPSFAAMLAVALFLTRPWPLAALLSVAAYLVTARLAGAVTRDDLKGLAR